MKKNLDHLGFKFKIGDIVKHKLTVQERYAGTKHEKITPILIVERMAQECCGGIQRFYTVRMGLSEASHVTIVPEKYFTLPETELEAIEEKI